MKTKSSLPPFAEQKGALNVIVECPKGDRNKYSYDQQTGFLVLTKVLPTGMVFPFNFGSIPSTLADDGDPLDIVLLLEEPVCPLCLVRTRLLGVIKAEQGEKGKRERNDRFVGTAIYKDKAAEVGLIKKLDPQMLQQIERFFVSYNELLGKEFNVLSYEGPKTAWELVKKGHTRYAKSQ